MSGILDRMAKRARGEASGVQPRMTPRFAAPAAARRETPVSMQGSLAWGAALALQTNDESLTIAEESNAGKAVRRDADSTGALSRGAQASRREEDGEAAEANGIRSMAAAQVVRARAGSLTDTERSAAREREVGSSSHGNRPSLEMPHEISPQAERSPLAGEDGSGERTARGGTSVADNERSGAELIHADSRLQTERDPAGEGTYQKAQSSRIQAAAGLSQRDSRRESSALPQGDAASREEKTEIHISIGNIELRAPRAETRPQPLPFRPRVTLEEFLRRQPEARR